MARVAPPSFRHSRPTAGKGRGARSNHSGRFEHYQREYITDGWLDALPSDPKTTVQIEQARRIITYNDSPYVGFDRSINPYRGCEHGCVYCFARPTHAYMGLSPGQDFETKLFVKPDAANLLRRELSKAKYVPHPIAIGTNTDPYQPIERGMHIMRNILAVLNEFKHPVSVLTKSKLILRDLDLLGPMAERGIARAMLSVTTVDPNLARTLEPRATRPEGRLAAIAALARMGIPTGVVHGPMIPGLNDHELENLMTASREAGATFAAYTILRLPFEVARLFEEWLDAYAPNRKARVLGHLRDMNGGRTYDPNWSRASGPKGAYALLLQQRFLASSKRLNFAPLPKLRTDLFAIPQAPNPQGELFG